MVATGRAAPSPFPGVPAQGLSVPSFCAALGSQGTPLSSVCSKAVYAQPSALCVPAVQAISPKKLENWAASSALSFPAQKASPPALAQLSRRGCLSFSVFWRVFSLFEEAKSKTVVLKEGQLHRASPAAPGGILSIKSRDGKTTTVQTQAPADRKS